MAGLPAGGETWSGPAELDYVDPSGKYQSIHGPSGISSLSGNDNLGGQSAQVRFHRSDLAEGLAALMRPMDRVRIEVLHPYAPIQSHRWTLFDGLVRDVQTSSSSGGGFSSRLSLTCGGMQLILQNSTFNWQGFIHPESSVLLGADGKTLYEKLSTLALQPQDSIKAFIESMLRTSMGLLVGDVQSQSGIPVYQADNTGYVKISDQWSSFLDLTCPCPWVHLADQSGQSFWSLMQHLCEPALHELFVGYRPDPLNNWLDVPQLIHRPRPFPGLPAYDANWHLPEVVRVGGADQASLFGSTDSRNDRRHPNCFHWAGGGLGDASQESLLSKIQWGWYVSNALVNRYGYAPAGISTFVAPLNSETDYNTWCGLLLHHYAAQEVPLSLMADRSLSAPFIPVRPGQILEDRSYGDSSEKVITGYVTGTTFNAQSDGDTYSLEMTVAVERSINGADASGYPTAVRSLVKDLARVPYAGAGVGDLGKAPAVNGTYTPPKPTPPKPAKIPAQLDTIIPQAAASQGIPSWVLAHVCHQESGMGKNVGKSGQGVCQITPICVTALISAGYTKNPDGTPFNLASRGDPKKNCFAAAKFLAMCRSAMQAAGCPMGGMAAWTWILASYTNGPTTTAKYGKGLNWVPPMGFYVGAHTPTVYANYYSPQAIQKGKALYG